jgi:hypothetical protein
MAAKKRLEKPPHKMTNFIMREQLQSPLSRRKIRNNRPPGAGA